MKNVIYVRQETLGNVAGRIDYISGEDRQENLYATYDTAPGGFWQDLARENQADFRKNGTRGSCIEARELVIALPPEMFRYDHEKLLQDFVERFKDKYQVECTAALHHNKTKKNFHIHLIYSERRELPEPDIKIASRNRYYDPDGKHVRTKKEATDDKGDLLPGYTMIPKGEVYESHRFQAKDKHFKDRAFVEEAKEFFTGVMNPYLSEKTQMVVFPKNSPYIANKKVGKNNSRAADIQADNLLRDEWNRKVDIARQMHVPQESMRIVKRRLVTEPIRQSREKTGKAYDPKAFRGILTKATKVLGIMIGKSKRFSRIEWEKAWIELLDNFIDFCIEKATGIDIKARTERSRQR